MFFLRNTLRLSEIILYWTHKLPEAATLVSRKTGLQTVINETGAYFIFWIIFGQFFINAGILNRAPLKCIK